MASGNTVARRGTLCYRQENFPLFHERAGAQAHTTMTGAQPHTETLQVVCITPPYGKRMLSDNFF